MLCGTDLDTGKENVTERMGYFTLTFGSFEAGRRKRTKFYVQAEVRKEGAGKGTMYFKYLYSETL